MISFEKDTQFVKFCAYGFLKNLRFYDAFLLLFFLENQLSFSQIGIIYATKEIVTNLCEVPSGFIADTHGRKTSLLAAFIIYILGFVIFYFSTHFPSLLLASIFIGIADAFRSGTHKGMIMDYLKVKGWEKYKIQYYGYTRSWSQIGSAISAIAAGVMVFYSGGYRVIYILTTIPYLLNFFNILSYPQYLNYSKTDVRQKRSMKVTLTNFTNTIRQPLTLQLINSAALHSAFLKSVKDYIQPLILNLALLIPVLTSSDAKSKSGLFIGIVYFVIFIFTAYASKSAHRLMRCRSNRLDRKTLVAGLLCGVISGLLTYFSMRLLALALFVFIFLIENVRKPILTGILSDQVPNQVLTSVFSAQSFYSTVIASVIALSMGILSDIFGIGMSLSCISICLLLFFLIIDRIAKR